MSEPRIIKKYPNRRLYDTVESRYITFEDLLRLVSQEVPFRVQDQRTQQDITRPVLLQVIAEQEHSTATLSQGFLLQLLSCYGNPRQTAVAAHLEDSLKRFLAA